MAMLNGRSIANALKTFFLENGRGPTVDEFRRMVTGKTVKIKAAPEQNETEEKAS